LIDRRQDQIETKSHIEKIYLLGSEHMTTPMQAIDRILQE